MSVELEPVELGFRRPFTKEVSEVLRIRNPHKDPVAFKVKTTAPKQYCVRPNSGRIEPGEKVEVQVLLQAMKEDPPLDAKCRDKFLVQSVSISPDVDTSNVAAVWTNLESKAKGSIEERKIRVSFLPASGAAATNHHTSSSAQNTPSRSLGGVTNPDAHEEPPAYSSPMPSSSMEQSLIYMSPLPGPELGRRSGLPHTKDERGDDLEIGHHGHSPDEHHITNTPLRSSSCWDDDRPKGSRDDEKNQDLESKFSDSPENLLGENFSNSASNAAAQAQAAVASAASTVAAAVPTSVEELKAQLAQAQDTISRLTKEAEQGLRQRKIASDSKGDSATSRATMTVQQAPGGVAVPVVAALCLLSFLLAYLFF